MRPSTVWRRRECPRGEEVSRSCWTGSLADARNDAFRCMVGNAIYDPCFTNQTIKNSHVLCPLYTPASHVLKVNLTKALPTPNHTGDPTRYVPWAIKLTNGRWCEIHTGRQARSQE